MAATSTPAEGSALRSFLAEEMGEDVETGAEASEEKAGTGEAYTRPNGMVYVGRQVPRNEAGIRDDVGLLKELRKAGVFPRLMSAPGTGKTAAMEAAFGDELITVVCGEGTDEDSLVGGHRPRPGGEWEWVDGPVTKAMLEGRPLLLDEFAAAHPRVQSRLNGVFDGRLELQLPEKDGGAVVRAAEGFWAAVAYNPGPHFELSDAMASRFALPIRYTTDLSVARGIGIPEKAVKLTRRLRRMVSAGEASWVPEMRELVAFKNHEVLLGETWAVGALIGAAPEECREEVAAACGEVFCGIAGKELEL